MFWLPGYLIDLSHSRPRQASPIPALRGRPTPVCTIGPSSSVFPNRAGMLQGIFENLWPPADRVGFQRQKISNRTMAALFGFALDDPEGMARAN
jgi:hypothetical protein